MNPMQTSNPTPASNLSGTQTASNAGAAALFVPPRPRDRALLLAPLTRPGISPFDEITWSCATPSFRITGRTIFEQKNVEVPADWSLTATNIVASKYLTARWALPSASPESAR